MAAVCSARRRARPTLWAAAAAAQIVTTGLTVATALTAKAAMRVRDPESTWSQFAAAAGCPFCQAVGGARPRVGVDARRTVLERPPAPHQAGTSS
jgi:hypothetical protein